MIEFTDSFSQAAVAEAMCPSRACQAHQSAVDAAGLCLCPRWEGRRIGGPLVAPNPVLHKTSLFVSPRDMREYLPRD